ASVIPAATRRPAKAARVQTTMERIAITVEGRWLRAGQGQRHDGARAALVARLDPDVAAPAARELARDREPDAGARRAPAPRPAAMEALEHGLALGGIDARPLVEDLDPAGLDRQDDRLAVRAVGERVLDQHVEDAVEVGAGAAHRRPLRAVPRLHGRVMRG